VGPRLLAIRVAQPVQSASGGLGPPLIARRLVSPLPIPGVVLDKHVFDLFGERPGVHGIRAHSEDVFLGEAPQHPPERDVGVGEDERPNVEPLRPGLAVPVLDEVDVVGLLEVQEPIRPAEGLAEERRFVWIANDNARLVTVPRALAHEADGPVSVDWKLDAGLGADTVYDLAGRGF